jgi:hypothetical protein
VVLPLKKEMTCVSSRRFKAVMRSCRASAMTGGVITAGFGCRKNSDIWGCGEVLTIGWSESVDGESGSIGSCWLRSFNIFMAWSLASWETNNEFLRVATCEVKAAFLFRTDKYSSFYWLSTDSIWLVPAICPFKSLTVVS